MQGDVLLETRIRIAVWLVWVDINLRSQGFHNDTETIVRVALEKRPKDRSQSRETGRRSRNARSTCGEDDASLDRGASWVMMLRAPSSRVTPWATVQKFLMEETEHFSAPDWVTAELWTRNRLAYETSSLCLLNGDICPKTRECPRVA